MAGALVLLRLIALDSDAYPRLSWSSGLLTDEGFYIHNARNRVLYGVERADDFNNALLMPLLHVVQVGVFQVFGVGAVPARMISVAASILAVGLFYSALRRAFGSRVAGVGALFLGLDHVYLLYNRMALMDTPASLLLIAAFSAFVCGLRRTSADPEAVPSSSAFFLCGVLLCAAYATRTLTLFALPIPLYVLWRLRAWRAFLLTALGMGGGLLVYGVCCYWPDRATIERMGRYYLHAQLLPHSLTDLRNNLGTALFSLRPGLFPYLLGHTPVLVGLAVWFSLRGGNEPDRHASVAYLRAWLWVPVALFAMASYAPSRYYVLFYPALAAMAALGWERLAGTAGTWSARSGGILLGVWAIINALWIADWLGHLRYSQREADRWLASVLPADSVVLGDAAPGLCMNNRLRAVPVLPGLCNDAAPVERFAPRALVILNGARNVAWWRARYPEILTPANQIRLFPSLVRFEVAVYRVPARR